ncbi:MAG: PAS domain S-box protein, partial [Bacteroidia bacterium]|nr:PAS domain S-box protein [Bacteroidia bacterium]
MNISDSILDNIDEGLMVIDPEGVILFVSKVAIAMGSSIPMIKPFQEGKKLQNLVRPNRKEAVVEIILETKNKKKSTRTFAEYLTSLGTTLFLEITYVPVLNEAGDVLTIQLFMRDITPQKVLEKKLISQAKNASNLIEKANAIIIGLDTSGYITDWNEHCCKVTGFDKAEVYTQKLTKVLLRENERPVFDLMMMRIFNNELISNYELLVQTKTGKIVTLLLSATPRTTVSGNVIGVMFVGQDITELIGYRISLEQKVEERTRELKRILSKEKAVVEMKNRFVSIASHEFRTPLSSIHHAASFIRDHKKIKSADLLKKLNGIEKQVDHMTSFLNDVLIYDKSEVGKIQPVITMIKLLDFTNKIIEDVEQVTQHTHVIHPAFHEIP